MNGEKPEPPVVTLTTDFGLADHYAGTMKGVLLSQCPGATLADISHEVTPFSITEGAYTLAQAWRYFPKGTVHLAVVDPGVGTERRAVAVKAGEHFFVAPDNGLLTLALESERYEAVHITKGFDSGRPISKTFHGRDVFAVAAGRLACGARLSTFGDPVEGLVRNAHLFETQTAAGWEGTVLSVDRFGNVVTNFETRRHKAIERSPFSIEAGGTQVSAFRPTFGAAQEGQLFAYFGSSGFVELGMREARAARALGVKPGDAIALRRLGGQ